MPKVTISDSLKEETIVNLQKDNDQKQAELHTRQLKIMNLEVKLMKMCKTDAYEDRLKILSNNDSFIPTETTDAYDTIAKSLLQKGLLYPSKQPRGRIHTGLPDITYIKEEQE
jgi:superfamily II helicase